MQRLFKTAVGIVCIFFCIVTIYSPAVVLARPHLVAVPGMTLTAPSQIFIGSNFTFQVAFDNTGGDTGYGPYLDVFLPRSGADGTTAGGPNDGITFQSASYLGASVTTQTLDCPAGTNITHPLTNQPVACPAQPGGLFSPFVWQMVVITLPFGSFVPGQPPAEVTINASLSNYADLNVPLPIVAGGGFMFGQDPLNNPASDPPVQGSRVQTSPNPTAALITLTKTYQGPEDETATGPNYPRRYTVTAQIAAGQTLTNFTLSDSLPNNMQFVSLVSTSPGGPTCSLPSTSTPGGVISCNFGSVSGTVSLTFEFYIPLRDASGNVVIDPISGNDVNSCNNASASGDWTPLDTRDGATTITVNPDGCEHTLTDKSIAIQKSVNNLSSAPLSPGDLLEYTLDIQVSDFFVFDQVVVTDVLSDGQRWDSSFTPTLQFFGNPAASNISGNFNPANYTVDTSQIGNTGPNPPADGTDGSTTITFRLSEELISRGQDGRLVGGCVPLVGTGGADPNCSNYNDGATTVRIVFRTVVQEEFSDTYPSGDASVDQNDVLTNGVSVSGRLLSVSDAGTPTGESEEDTSGSSLRIPQGVISKSIYAINGNTTFSTPVRVAPGDVVTYRVRYDLQTSDFEDLIITDYLPLPVFNAAEVTSFNNALCGVVPPAGQACLGPADTYSSLSGAVNPVFSTSGMSANNSLTWNYGRYDSAYNAPSVIDLLFSVTVRNDPFADGLFLTNQANGREGSTNSSGSSSNGIVQIQLQEPVLSISKGVVWTSNTVGQFSPAAVGPVTFDGTALTCSARLGGAITSSGLAASPVNSNVSRVDAGDTLMMAVVIENTGRWSAYDVRVRDSLPTGMTFVSNSLCVTDGAGDAFTYTGSQSDFFTANGITLQDPGPTATPTGALDPGRQGDGTPNNDGRNIAVITYLVTLDSGVIAGGSLTNTATLLGYAGAEGGQNHMPGGLSDEAAATIANPVVAKQLVSSEIDNSYNGNTQTVIGELVTYRVTITVPEGMTQNAQIVDTLDSGLAFVDCQSITASGGVSTSLSGGFAAICAAPTVANSGRTVTFDLGNLTNADTNNSIAETITITYRVVVLNVSGNQSGTLLNNSARLTWSNGSTTASAANVTLIEPAIQISKSVSPATTDAGNTVTYTVVLTNPASGSTSAFEVAWEDTIQPELSYQSNTLSVSCSSGVSATLNDSGAPTLRASFPQINPGQSCTLTYQATVNYIVSPGQTVGNTATVQWSSLSGTITDRSSYNPDSDERDGSGGINDYRAQATTNLTIQAAQPNKYLVATSEAHTGIVSGNSRVAIGEIVRYRMVVQLPEGSSPNFQIQDLLPPGLQFLDDNTAQFALIADGAGISSTGVGSVPAVDTGSCTVSGTSADATTPATLPCSLPDLNIGSDSNTSSGPDSYTSGSDPYFKFGNLTNNDNDADGEFVVVEFNALVLNISGGGGNNAGTTRNNQARVLINGSQNGSDSTVVQVVIAEPDLTLSKSQTSFSDAGDTVTYTLTITAASSGDNRATAFDLSLSDTLNTYLTPNTTSLSIISTQPATCAGNGGGTTTFSTTAGWSGNTLTVTATCLDPGRSITISFQAVVNASVPAGYTLPNTANLSYTSLPGSNGTTPNLTGSITPGASGSSTGERVTNRNATINQLLGTPQISKQAPPASGYPIGGLVTYPIRVTLPEGVTRNLRVTDAVPSGMQYVSYSLDTSGFNGSAPTPTVSGGVSDGDDVTFTFGDTTTAGDNLAANNTFFINITLRVLDVSANQIGSTLVNSASLIYTPGTGSSDTTFPGGSQSVTVVEPRITTTKSVSPLNGVQAGDTLTYTVRFSNTGTATAYDVTAEDVLAQSVAYNNDAACIFFNGSASAGIAVSETVSGGRLILDGNPSGAWDIPAGGYIECTYTAVALNSIELDGTHTNTIDADWTSLDGVDTSERVYDDTVSRTVDGTQDTAAAAFNSPAPAIAKSDGNTSGAVVGQVINYTLTLTSPLGTLRELSVSDTLPAGLIYVSGSQSVSSGISPVPAFSVSTPNDGSMPVTLAWQFGNAVVSSSPVTISFQAQIANTVSNQNGVTLNNTTTLTYTNADGSPVTRNASDDLTIREPELEVLKTGSDSTPPPNGTVTYTLTVRHRASSTADAFDLTLTDLLPTDLSYVTGSLTYVDGVAPTALNASPPNLTILWDRLPLGSQSVVSYQVKVPVGSNGQSYTNTAALGWSSLSGTVSGERDGSGGVNDYTASAQTSLTSTGPDLAIQKTDGDSSAVPGGLIVYTLTYQNNGNGAASGVVVTETVPQHTTFVAASSTAGWSCADGSPAGTTCTYSLGELAIGADGTLTFAVQVVDLVAAGVTQIENTATIGDDGSRGPDPTPSDNSDTDTTPLAAAPDLAITKDDGVSVTAPGATLTYTLRIENRGNQTATGVMVTDTLPAGVTFISASDGGTYEEINRQVTWPAFDLAAGAPAQVRSLTVRVNDPLEAGITRLLNTVVVRDDGQNGDDPTPDDNTATDENRLGGGGKRIITSNQDFTELPKVAIGEILTYEVRFKAEAGQQVENLTFRDVLDEGLAFVACDEITASAEGLVSSRGALSDLCASAVIGPYPPGSADTSQYGRLLNLDFGSLSNPTENDIELTVRYRVVVLNSPVNRRGNLLANQAEWKWQGGSLSLQAPAVRVAEPTLTVSKMVDPDVGLPGSTVSFRLVVKPDPVSDTSAWDVVLSDTLPRGLVYVPGSLRFISGLVPTLLDDRAAPLLRMGWEVIPADAPETVLAFEAEIGNLTPGDQVENVALLAWSSLPGSVSDPQSPYNLLSDERRFQPGSSLNTYGSQAGAEISVPLLPATGFAPQRVTMLPLQPASEVYKSLPALLLEIPALGVRRPIVGVPLQDGQWNLTWLNSQIGWLQGTAYPTLPGNTALTAHVYDANGLPGAFVNLHTLKWGDVILIRTANATYHYEVREVRRVQPNDLTVLRHEERDWLTLITCQGYQEAQDRYQWRVAVRAVLMKVTP